MSEKGFEVEIGDEDKPLFVAFGGLSMKIGIPPFEFKKFLHNSFGNINYIFIRDLDQFWYFSGIRGISTGHETTEEWLSLMMGSIDHTKTIFVGNSMGAYAALLYGIRLGVDNIFAFSPQTFLDTATRRKHRDERWEDIISEINRKHSMEEELNLNFLKRYDYKGKVYITFGGEVRVDAIHAKNMAFIENCTIKKKARYGHNVISTLRRSGRLYTIISRDI